MKTYLKPPGVPDHAVWVGGEDGGAFVVFVGRDPFYHIVVYNDFSGEVEADGRFVHVADRDDEKITPGPGTTFSAWDGRFLYIKDGGYLCPVGETSSHLA